MGDGSFGNLGLAVSQHASGVTGDQTSPWARAAGTPGEVMGVGTRWAHSLGQTRDAWANLTSPSKPGGPPPTGGQVAARTLRATQQTVGALLGAFNMGKDMLDVGFANLTAPLAAIFPSLPAATLLSPYLGTPHCHPTHPPSGPPPIPPTPLPSLGMVTLGVTPRVLINYLPAARVEDIGLAPTCCGIPPAWFKIKTGSSNVFIGGMRAARIGDICQACKNIPEAPSIPAGRALAAIGKAAGAVSKAVAVGGYVAGGLGMAADIAEAAVEDDAAMASAKALSAAMAAAQMAADAAKMAVEATMWKDPTLPPTGSIGAIIDPSHATVLIGGFPMINIPNPADALLNRLKRYKAQSPAESEKVGPKACP
ncbi:PAAR domain-containing protein [Variovorax robiniae]|uniref:PAAR domain-containing protein n=1 Tax=Variovorax robiniae TaxID=1836199 RepID=A0ABU8XE21_9BURK